MKWFRNPCARRRESLCLLASGTLAEAEQAEVRSHLAACPDCREYYDQIRAVTAPLADWARDFSQVQPEPTVQARWAKAVVAASRPAPARRFSFRLAFQTAWRELIRPCRFAWTGMAALWLVMWGINLGMSGGPKDIMTSRSAPSPAIFQAIEEQRRVLAELIPPAVNPPIEPPRRNDPRPRSERMTNWDIA